MCGELDVGRLDGGVVVRVERTGSGWADVKQGGTCVVGAWSR